MHPSQSQPQVALDPLGYQYSRVTLNMEPRLINESSNCVRAPVIPRLL